MYTDNSGVWTKLGTNLPNAVSFDLEYNAADDVLLVSTFGRGAWTIPNVTTELFGPPPAIVVG